MRANESDSLKALASSNDSKAFLKSFSRLKDSFSLVTALRYDTEIVLPSGQMLVIIRSDSPISATNQDELAIFL
jgi:hypothetical protein